MMARLQEPQDEKRHIRRRLALLTLVVLPLVAGGIIWILSAAGLIHGAWSSVFGPAFTSVGAVATVAGVIFALPRLDRLSPVNVSSGSLAPPPSTPHASPVNFRKKAKLGASWRKGSLFVIGNRRMSGRAVHVCPGFDNTNSPPQVASNIVLHNVDGSRLYSAAFSALKPGNYTVSVHPAGPSTNVTIEARQIAEIDWRLYTDEKN